MPKGPELRPLIAEGFKVKAFECRSVQGRGPWLPKGSGLRPLVAEGFKVKALKCRGV